MLSWGWGEKKEVAEKFFLSWNVKCKMCSDVTCAQVLLQTMNKVTARGSDVSTPLPLHPSMLCLLTRQLLIKSSQGNFLFASFASPFLLKNGAAY